MSNNDQNNLFHVSYRNKFAGYSWIVFWAITLPIVISVIIFGFISGSLDKHPFMPAPLIYFIIFIVGPIIFPMCVYYSVVYPLKEKEIYISKEGIKYIINTQTKYDLKWENIVYIKIDLRSKYVLSCYLEVKDKGASIDWLFLTTREFPIDILKEIFQNIKHFSIGAEVKIINKLNW